MVSDEQLADEVRDAIRNLVKKMDAAGEAGLTVQFEIKPCELVQVDNITKTRFAATCAVTRISHL